MQRLLASAGIDSTRAADPEDPSRTNLFASVGPTGVPGVMLSGHTDVVPAEGQPWSSPPYQVREHEGRLYGAARPT